MRGTDGFKIENAGVGASTEFPLSGGRYQVAVGTATFGGGNVVLQQLANNNSTWFAVGTAITAAGANVSELPPGRYRLFVTTATGVYATVIRIPGE